MAMDARPPIPTRSRRRAAPAGFLLGAILLAAAATAIAAAIAGPVGRSSGVGPALPAWTHPQVIDGVQSTGGHGVPAPTVVP